MVRRVRDPDTMTVNYIERLDPGGRTAELSAEFAPLASGPVTALLRRRGVDDETLATLRAAPRTYKSFAEDLDRIASTLAPIGWIAFNQAPHAEYRAAALLAEAGDTEEAEQLLVDVWNELDRLDHLLSRVGTVHVGDPEQDVLGAARFELLREALAAHRAELFGPAITTVLSQIDGIVFDMTGKDARSFFATGRKASHLIDEKTLAGHPSGLTVLAALFCKDAKTTQHSGRLMRHGIVHGRELGFNTLMNSTKAFVALLAVIEWAQPRARELADDRRRAEEERWAGSDEVDERGRRRDRRGFLEAKKLLHRLSYCQHGFFIRHGSYCADLKRLDPGGPLGSLDAPALTVEVDGRSFFGWIRTPSGWVFALAGRDGDSAHYEFAGPTPPSGPPGGAEEWRHSATEIGPPDW